MFYSVDGKIVQVEDAFPERRVNTLTFEVEGDRFPINVSYPVDSDRNYFFFDSNGPNSVVINWGDGETSSYVFGTDFANGNHRIGWTPNGLETTRGVQGDTLAPVHIFQDGYIGRRSITFEFEDLSKLLVNVVSSVALYGKYPEDLKYATNLVSIAITNCGFLDEVPNFFSNLKEITTFSVRNAFVTQQGYLPDNLFSAPLSYLGTDEYDLRNSINSNLFKIDQVSETLERVEISSGIDYIELPNSLSNCQLISDLRLGSCKNYLVLSQLKNLTRLYYDVFEIEDNNEGWIDFTNHTKLNAIFITNVLKINTSATEKIPIVWKPLVSLKSLTALHFWLENYTTEFDRFIDALYTLVTNEAYLDISLAPIGETHPNKFRNMSWGWSVLTQTGAIQAPAGFVLGSANGTPANQGEKIYVLVNNYGHTITTA